MSTDTELTIQPAPAQRTGQPALSLEDLNVTFATPYGEVRAVKGLSLAVERGECLGVVGESGAGKSQAFLAALGLLAANGRASGRARFGSNDLMMLRRRELERIRGRRIGVVFQDPLTSLTPHLRVGDQIAEVLVHHEGMSWREARAHALQLLNQAHVTEAARRMQQYPHELSGGMRQRVMIAAALACRPDLLIADEPTTALDVTIQAQILALLAELRRTRGMAMVLITHDLAALAGIADRVAVIRAGELVELDRVDSLFRAPRHAYTRMLLEAVPRIDAGLRLPARAAAAEQRLVLDDLQVRFSIRSGWRGTRAVLRAVDGVSLELAAGQALGIVGESGSGKSTLVRAALELVRAQAGRILWLGKPVAGLTQRALRPLRRDIQVVFQDPLASLDPRMTARQIVSEPLQIHRPELAAAARERLVMEMLARVGLDAGLAMRYPHELSGGQCQRVGIARAMVLEPRVLICDEPLSALDVTVQEQIVRLLVQLKSESGLSILFVSHNLAVVQRLCERILVLYLGRMMEQGPAATIYARPLHPYTRELLQSAPVPDPAIQRARLARARLGEPPSALSPPTGCVYRSRCPHAAEICRERVPPWEAVDEGVGRVACHRWRDIASGSALVSEPPA